MISIKKFKCISYEVHHKHLFLFVYGMLTFIHPSSNIQTLFCYAINFQVHTYILLTIGAVENNVIFLCISVTLVPRDGK
jgi:hypothetical protein